MKYVVNVQEPWFFFISQGIKTVEGRLDKGRFASMCKGDIIVFENNSFGYHRSFIVEITSVRRYVSFRAYLTREGLQKCLPSVEKIEDGIKVYRQFYTKTDESKHGVVAIGMKVLV